VKYAGAYPKIRIMGDFSLNIFNSVSIKTLKDMGLDGATLSCELNLNQIREMGSFRILWKKCWYTEEYPL